MRLGRLCWWITVIWYHSALATIVISDYFAVADHPYANVRHFVDTYEVGIALFICGGLLAYLLSVLVLLVLERRIRKVRSLRQLGVYFLAGLPFYGPFYYAKQIKLLHSVRRGPDE
jgi:hypothetical protein